MAPNWQESWQRNGITARLRSNIRLSESLGSSGDGLFSIGRTFMLGSRFKRIAYRVYSGSTWIACKRSSISFNVWLKSWSVWDCSHISYLTIDVSCPKGCTISSKSHLLPRKRLSSRMERGINWLPWNVNPFTWMWRLDKIIGAIYGIWSHNP